MNRFVSVCSFIFVLVSQHASAQCAGWNSGFHLPDADNEVRDIQEFGTGPGAPDLFVCGTFKRIADVDAIGLARWNGTSWSAVGSTNAGGWVNCMTVFDDGTGPALYVSGTFTSVGGVPANGIARWNGTSWSSLGSGISGGASAMIAFNDGSGPALYAGGDFTSAGGTTAFRIARWNGSAWSAVGTAGANGTVGALEVHDDGTGPALYAAGSFTFLDVSTNRCAKWNGIQWSAMPGSPNGTIRVLKSWNDGSGSKLYALGDFTQYQGPSSCIARWNGSAWSSVGGGFTVASGSPRATSATIFDDGTGAALFVSGRFGFAGGNPAMGLAKWSGSSWSPAFGGASALNGDPPSAAKVDTWNAQSGPQFILGGSALLVGSRISLGLATWSGSWSALGTGLGLYNGAQSFAEFDAGNGPELFVGGGFTPALGGSAAVRFGKWDGTKIVPVGTGANGLIRKLVVFDDGAGPRLFAEGDFTSIDGFSVSRIAKWDGTTWTSATAGLTTATPPMLAVFDSGTGSELLEMNALQKWNGTSWVASALVPPLTRTAVGTVQEAGGQRLYVSGTRYVQMVTERRVAVFDGTTWTILGDTFDSEPHFLCSFDDGSGPAVHAFGPFTMIGTTPITGAAKWNGSAWVPLGAGLSGPPGGGTPTIMTASSVPASGLNPAKLYVGGLLTAVGVPTSGYLARWDGSSWSDVDGTTNGVVTSLYTRSQSGETNIWVGGGFTRTGNKVSFGLARYTTACPTTPFCFGDATGTVCPCANAGAAGNGCASSAFPQGAHLSSTGTAGASMATDTLVLNATDIPGPGLFFQGSGQYASGFGIPFGDGLLCAGGTIIRMGIVFPTGSTASYPGGLTPFPIHVAGAVSGGDVRHYQCWYRDAAVFCSASTFNLTQGLTVLWTP